MKFHEQEKGDIRIYEQPKPDTVYIVGADIAEGLESGDYSTAFVMDRAFNQVASIHNHIAPDLFGNELVNLATFYNRALLIHEVNNHGIAVTVKIKELGYENVYQSEVIDTHEVNIRKRIGWYTNVKTKQLLLDELKAAVRDNSLNIKDIDLLREMTTVFYKEDGNVELGGKDRVVAAGLAIQGLKQAPLENEYTPTFPTSEDNPPKFEGFHERIERRLKKGDSYFE